MRKCYHINAEGMHFKKEGSDSAWLEPLPAGKRPPADVDAVEYDFETLDVTFRRKLTDNGAVPPPVIVRLNPSDLVRP